jgi:bifunctional ADP-heptose synthase (sugar kinase/adenylyltransferase)
MEKTILVAGDVCQDVYLFSNQKKLNPEHTSPIYKVDRKR